MSTNKKAALAGTGTASKTISDNHYDTKADALTGGYFLAANVKPDSTDRQPERIWKRGQK